MEIVKYEEKYHKYFIEFNTDWIVDNFNVLEKEDIDTFNNLKDNLQNGAMVYFTIEEDVVLATCMTIPMGNDTWEICKLASNKHVEHKGAGSEVFKATMKYAIDNGAKKIFLISNRKLKPALHIYEKFGFEEIKLADYEYCRGDIAYEYLVQ